jgi:hypothetical protein
VLAQLNQIGGVLSTAASLGNEGGSLIRVTLRPGADPATVAEQIRRVLSEAVRERPVEAVAGRAAAALQQKEWLDTNQLADIAASEMGGSRRTRILLALLFAAIGVALCLLGWRYLRNRRADSSLAANGLRP